MVDRLLDRFTLLFFLVVTAVGFVAWLAVLVLIWFVLTAFGATVDFWVMTEVLSTALAGAAVFGAGLIAYRELKEVSSSRHLEVVDRLFEELNSAENVEARRWVFQNLPADPEEGVLKLTPEGRAAVKQVLNSLDRIAFLTQADWVPEEMVMPWMNPMITKAWTKATAMYVDYEVVAAMNLTTTATHKPMS